ncbi:MAG: DUF4013 domain-containing protein [Methanomicrobiaceae archaeon]|nr:DUF4013 domain-containing protein [Methanomicrobiaceae archaeon]
MDIGTMLGDSFEYTKEGLVGKWMRWILLVICAIIFPLFYGYIVRILKGASPAPELEDWVRLLIDGIKLLIIGIIYSIPVFIVLLLVAGGSLAAFASQDPAMIVAAVGTAIVGILAAIIVAIIVYLFAIIGSIRFARMDSMGEAFNFSAILETIGKIGWVSYIIALIVVYIVVFIVEFIIAIIMSIPLIGWIIGLLATPAIGIFMARYLALLYESAESSA